MADFYTAKELAELLGLHPQTIYRKLYRGELKSVKFGRTVRFPADQFDFTNHNLEVQSVDYKTLSIPSFVLSLFWDVDSKELKANDYQLIERVLDRGNIPEAKWLLSHVPESRLIEFIKKRGKRRLNKISLNFWQKFLGLKNGSDSSTRNPKKLWVKIAGVKNIDNFYLAGGTAIALHLGHRESIDFDFFTDKNFINDKLLQSLEKLGKLKIDEFDKTTLLGWLDNVKLSFFKYRHPCLEEPEEYRGLKVASIEDLVAMKIIAISQRGTKKDFIDFHAIIKSGWNFEAIFSAIERKYHGAEYNKMHLLKSLTYFNDTEDELMPKMLKSITWEQVKAELEEEVLGFIK